VNTHKTKVILWGFITTGLFLTLYFGFYFKNPAAAVFYFGSTLFCRVFVNYPETLLASSISELDVDIENIRKDKWFWISLMIMVAGSTWSSIVMFY